MRRPTEDRELRARYLAEVLATLYPTTDGGSLAEFVAVPNARRPRLLVPAGSRRVAACPSSRIFL